MIMDRKLLISSRQFHPWLSCHCHLIGNIKKLTYLLFLLSAKHKVIFNISRQMIIRPLIWWIPFFVPYLSAVVLPFVWYLSEFFFFWLIPTTEQQWVVIRRNFAGLLSFFLINELPWTPRISTKISTKSFQKSRKVQTDELRTSTTIITGGKGLVPRPLQSN